MDESDQICGASDHDQKFGKCIAKIKSNPYIKISGLNIKSNFMAQRQGQLKELRRKSLHYQFPPTDIKRHIQ